MIYIYVLLLSILGISEAAQFQLPNKKVQFAPTVRIQDFYRENESTNTPGRMEGQPY